MAGLHWTDVIAKGNDFGMAMGMPVFAIALTGSVTPDDGGWAWELWYKFQITENITLTPSLIYLSRPLGQATPTGESLNQFGGLIKTSLKF
jgi:carbohydrate-selective porin OprB